jgi:hypothetical protein
MKLSHSVTKVTAFSRLIATFVLVVLILAGFRLGILYQRSIETPPSHLSIPVISPTPQQPKIPKQVNAPNRPGWYRYMSNLFDYYIDYPYTYVYGNDTAATVSFEKMLNYPHGIGDFIFIDRGPSLQFSQAKIDEMKQMAMGEIKVVMKKESSLPSQFKTYERLPDTYFGTKKAMSFVNKDVWEAGEGTYLYVYIYDGSTDYVFGGLTTEIITSEDAISYSEFKEIISTLRFLDE